MTASASPKRTCTTADLPSFYPLPTETVAAMMLDHLMMEVLRQRDSAGQDTTADPAPIPFQPAAVRP